MMFIHRRQTPKSIVKSLFCFKDSLSIPQSSLYVSIENIFLITTSGRLGIIGGLDLKTAGTDEASFSVVEADFLTFFTTFLTTTFFFLTGIGANGGSTFVGSERGGGGSSFRTVGILGGSIFRVEIGAGVGNFFAGADPDIIMGLRR